MPLVGDVILSCREQFPDIPQTVNGPSLTATPGTGGNLPAGSNYYVIATCINPWGETIVSNEVGPLTVAANGIITATISNRPTGVVASRVYYGNLAGPGLETSYVQSTADPIILGSTSAPLTLLPGQPPNFSTAFNPDSDGSSVGAFTIYRWLNDAIQELGRIAGGILDMTGMPANTLASDYVVSENPCPWIRFTDAWFDGYFCQDFKRRNQWRRQFIGAISFYWSVEQVNRQMVLNFYPAPNRNAAVGNLAAPMGTTDNTIPLVSVPVGMRMPGMCQIDNEIIIYSTTQGNNLTGAIRGMGGTTAATHLANATVTEFNLILAGFRQPNTYSVGQAANELMIPTGWETPISNFVMSRYRNYEQNRQEAADLYKQFVEEAKRIAFDSRQFPASNAIGGPASFLTLYPGGPFGVIIP